MIGTWPASNRNGGRLHVGTLADFKSEYPAGFGRNPHFTAWDRFQPSTAPPRSDIRIPVEEWRKRWNRRLRPFLLPANFRDLYSTLCRQPDSHRLGEIASVGIGYITGANDFFHLRPSMAERFGIPSAFLQPTVRNSRVLPCWELTRATLEEWHRQDEPYLLLRLPKLGELPSSVRRYLVTEEARIAKTAYKCRMRKPWYAVPDVRTPQFFLTYMSGRRVELVRNGVGASCTNTLHAVSLADQRDFGHLIAAQRSPLFQFSCELEGHPLGGGMLKLEPREAGRILLPDIATLRSLDHERACEGLGILQRWRHYNEPIEIERFDRTPALPVGFHLPYAEIGQSSAGGPARQISPFAERSETTTARASPL